MTSFCILNLIFAIGTSLWLARIYFMKRYLFIKPSLILLTYTHIFFQWPLVLLTSYCEQNLNNPYIVSFLINGYIFCGLLISPFIFQGKAQIIWKKLDSKEIAFNSRYYYASIMVLLSLVFFTSLLYFSFFSFYETALYAIFFNPAQSEIIREKSLKLIDSQALKYLYSITRSAVVPLLFSLVFLRMLNRSYISHFKPSVLFFEIPILTICAIFSSLTGERSFLAYLVLLGGLLILWGNKLKFQPMKFLLIIFLSAIPPLIFTFFRSGGTFYNFNFFLSIFYFGDIFERIFIVPFKVGIWYAKYVQDVSPFGIAAYEKLSKIFGVSPLNAPNIIGLKYAPEYYQSVTSRFGFKLLREIISIYNLVLNQSLSVDDILAMLPLTKTPVEARKHISAGAGYLLSYYGYLGIFSFPLSLLGLLLLDIALLAYMRVRDFLLIPCLACISLICLAFIQADYLVTWCTHGYGAILLLALGISKSFDLVSKQLIERSYGSPKAA